MGGFFPGEAGGGRGIRRKADREGKDDGAAAGVISARSLLALLHVLNIKEIKIPWTVTEGAIVQHLAKLRTRLENEGIKVTPVRGGRTRTNRTTVAKNFKTVSAKGAMAKRTGNSTAPEKSDGRIDDSEDDFQLEEISPRKGEVKILTAAENAVDMTESVRAGIQTEQHSSDDSKNPGRFVLYGNDGDKRTINSNVDIVFLRREVKKLFRSLKQFEKNIRIDEKRKLMDGGLGQNNYAAASGDLNLQSPCTLSQAIDGSINMQVNSGLTISAAPKSTKRKDPFANAQPNSASYGMQNGPLDHNIGSSNNPQYDLDFSYRGIHGQDIEFADTSLKNTDMKIAMNGYGCSVDDPFIIDESDP